MKEKGWVSKLPCCDRGQTFKSSGKKKKIAITWFNCQKHRQYTSYFWFWVRVTRWASSRNKHHIWGDEEEGNSFFLFLFCWRTLVVLRLQSQGETKEERDIHKIDKWQNSDPTRAFQKSIVKCQPLCFNTWPHTTVGSLRFNSESSCADLVNVLQKALSAGLTLAVISITISFLLDGMKVGKTTAARRTKNSCRKRRRMNGMKLLQALLMLVISVRVDFSILIRTKYGTEGFSLSWQNDFTFHCAISWQRYQCKSQSRVAGSRVLAHS